MRRIALTGGKVLSPGGSLAAGTLLIEDTKIVGILEKDAVPETDVETVDVSGCIVAPGFIDTHVHGGGGHNFMEGTRDALSAISGHMVKGGVTSCLATTTSATLPDLERAVQNAVSAMEQPREAEVNILGVHLEGPFINPQHRGVHVQAQVREATLPELQAIMSAAGSALRVVTLAPEMPYGTEAARFFATHGVSVSIGHTGATYEETKLGLANGVRRSTHTFNAMPPIHHRNPGPITALFEDPAAHLEFIVDGHHVHPAAIGMAIRQIGAERAILITDCTDVAGQGEGTFTRWEGTDVVIKDGQSRTLSGGLAGSILRMDEGVKNLVTLVGLPIEQALRMASENPARSIGAFDTKGSLAPGKDADVVVLNEDFSVAMTMIQGQVSYDCRMSPETHTQRSSGDNTATTSRRAIVMERQVTVNHPEGLHARPASEFVKAAAGFQSKIEVVVGAQTANAKSILSLLKLGVQHGQSMLLRADGPDAEDALTELSSLLEHAV